MKRYFGYARLACFAGVVFLNTAATPVLAEEPAHGPAAEQTKHNEERGTNVDAWKIANFVLLIGALGYMIGKKGGPFFRSRTDEIRKGIDEAARLKQEADAKYADMERRLADLDKEIAQLKAHAGEEARAESERLRQETQRELQKVQVQAEQEIEGASKAARQDLRAYSAELAIRLAEQKIKERINSGAQEALVESMLSGLAKRGAERQPNQVKVS